MSSNTLTVQVTFVERCLKAARPDSNTDRGAPPAVRAPDYTARPRHPGECPGFPGGTHLAFDPAEYPQAPADESRASHRMN